jgi:hypothetical protein
VTTAAAVAAKGVAPDRPTAAAATAVSFFVSHDTDLAGGIEIMMEASGAISISRVSAWIDAAWLASTCWAFGFIFLSPWRWLKPMDKRKAYAASSRL